MGRMSAAARANADSSTSVAVDITRRARVLILRSARMPQFERAVRSARSRHPQAEILALSHRGHRDALLRAGVDNVIEIPGRRFGLWHVSPFTLLRLRAALYDEVVIPQMCAYADVHMNLYWMALALRPGRVVMLPGDEAEQAFEWREFPRWVLQHAGLRAWLVGFDVPVFLGMLAAACLVRRPAAPDTRGRRRRVLHIISSLGVGGAQVQLAEVLNRTPAEDYDLELLVLGESDGDFSRQWLKRPGLTVEFVKEWPRLVPSVREIAARCRERHYDAVHTWLFMANIVGAAAARLAGVPLVVGSVRNLSVWKRERWYRKWWHRTADVLGSHAADVVTVNANALVADHARWALMRRAGIQVVHNGLDPARFTHDRGEGRRALLEMTGAPARALLVGTVGRLAHEKDQATFLRILAAVRASRPEVHGVVIGDGELRASLEQLAESLGLGGAVSFLGSRSDARRLMAGFDLFLLTSRSEGFPNVLLEATFLGVACVATNLAGNPDVLERAESLFPEGNIEDGAARVLDALAAPEATAAQTTAVRARAIDMFTSERSVATWLTLYERCFTPWTGRSHGASGAAVGEQWTSRSGGGEDRDQSAAA